MEKFVKNDSSRGKLGENIEKNGYKEEKNGMKFRKKK